jgi:hypothetical protein
MTDKYTWFTLSRHNEPDPPADPPTDPPVDPPADPLGDAGKKALQEERAARKAAEKALAERDAKLREFEDRDKTETEKQVAAREAAEKRAVTATARAVRAEVKAAAGEFADPTDAVALLGDLSKYATGDDIDADAITADLTALLEQKPHLRKAAVRTGPRPDPSQGGGREGGPTDFKTADSAAFAAELAKYGLRPQSYS